ncbi:alpha/beta hydrolase [Nonomuraea sp. 3-1Str]|nr:hypothetical protein [Nonomuraea sp. 3-1Str]MDR8408432.1 alpha/beta hydrolase [Nonomuraea sp. 3-1Str]
MIEGFRDDEVRLDGEVPVFFRHAGQGPPVVLLHGHPRTSATWHRVAPRLVGAGFTVACPDTPRRSRAWPCSTAYRSPSTCPA